MPVEPSRGPDIQAVFTWLGRLVMENSIAFQAFRKAFWQDFRHRLSRGWLPAALEPGEDIMPKYLPIYAALMALSAVPLHAEEKEAFLQKATVPGSTFEVLLAVPKTGAAMDIGKSPEAFVVHLVGGQLALAFENGEEMLQALDSLRAPIGAFHVQESCSKSLIPVAAYILSKDGTRAQAVD